MTVPASLPARRRTRNRAAAVPARAARTDSKKHVRELVEALDDGDEEWSAPTIRAVARLLAHEDHEAVLRELGGRHLAAAAHVAAFHARSVPEVAFDVFCASPSDALAYGIAAEWRPEWTERLAALLDKSPSSAAVWVVMHLSELAEPIPLRLWIAAIGATTKPDLRGLFEGVWGCRTEVVPPLPVALPKPESTGHVGMASGLIPVRSPRPQTDERVPATASAKPRRRTKANSLDEARGDALPAGAVRRGLRHLADGGAGASKPRRRTAKGGR